MKSYTLVLGLALLGNLAPAATTLFHFSVNDTDAAGLPTIPSIGGSDGTAQGTFSGILSSNVPTIGVPAGAGNRSIVGAFDVNSGGVNSASSLELSNAAIIAEGGFTFETWFLWNGGGNVNSIIDYAGTDKFRIPNGGGILDMNFDQGSGPQVLGNINAGQWYYVAMVFEHDGSGGPNDPIGGTMTWYLDSLDPAGTAAAVKSTFGDSLNRPIGIGRHPSGFTGDNFDGLIYEPRVSLGALSSSELLFVPEPGSTALLALGLGTLALRRRRA